MFKSGRQLVDFKVAFIKDRRYKYNIKYNLAIFHGLPLFLILFVQSS